MPTDNWTFLTNHSHVLVCILQDQELRVREIADKVGITERAALRILGELQSAGIVTAEKMGRRNKYTVHLDRNLRHPLESHKTLGDLMTFIRGGE
jgi:predicted ArsR family transcriptional regulator